MRKIILAITLVFTMIVSAGASLAGTITIKNKGWYTPRVIISVNGTEVAKKNLLLGKTWTFYVSENARWGVTADAGGSRVGYFSEATPDDVELELHGTVFNPSLRVI